MESFCASLTLSIQLLVVRSLIRFALSWSVSFTAQQEQSIVTDLVNMLLGKICIDYNIDSEGFLEKSKSGNYTRRQDCPKVYEYNGAIFVVNIASLKKMPENHFEKVKKIVMDDLTSVDLDRPIDWLWAEFLLENKKSSFQ